MSYIFNPFIISIDYDALYLLSALPSAFFFFFFSFHRMLPNLFHLIRLVNKVLSTMYASKYPMSHFQILQIV